MDDTVKDSPPIAGLDLGEGTGTTKRWVPWALGVAAVAMLAGGYALWRGAGSDGEPRYRTEAAARGRLVVTVSATGSLQPTNKVDIGSELSGQVERVLVDDNDVVKQGQLLAQLDLSKLTDQAERSRSAATSAQARVRQAEATHQEARTTLERLREVRELSGGKVPSEIEMAKAEATLSRAIADEAAARAAVEEAAAQVRSDETNLRKAAIRSPINGVVLARKVEPGQTVAASLQAPVLFTLAENLRQMELQVDVDEADVGRVRDGQSAVFTVDAYPGRRYPAKVMRVGYGSQVKDNVVTYPTLLTVDNEDLTLRPGMTATAEITAAIREGALLVPNAALRFNPAASSSAAPEPSQSLVSKLIPRPPRSGSTPRKARDNSARVEQRVWVLRDGQPVEVPVTTGLSDGQHTEVTGGKLEPGAQVIVEATAAK